MPANALSGEKSPYLLQHAHNPVDWHPWGGVAFEKARQEGKPIFLSIGYSTCHWCHVMERESFESQEIASILNRHFVAIKVDREERPDVDAIYMSFVQATSGSGGWPMSVFLTPELKPFFGGTYFPPDNRYGRPGFSSILKQIAASWEADRARIVESGESVVAQLRDMATPKPVPGELNADEIRTSTFLTLRRMFDTRLGGFGTAPKFPRPVVFNFLLREARWMDNDEALEMSVRTLKAMARGGMYDQIGGGFHRYSVDARWFVPHFEKMLYDQAQLAIAYLETFQLTGAESLRDVAQGIFRYVLRDMTSVDGGFYSAEDADSVIDAADPKHKGEGAFYIFTYEDLMARLGKPHGDWFCYRYGCAPGGNVDPAEDPHEEFTNQNILFEAHTVEETARQFDVSDEEIAAALAACATQLMQARAGRVRPGLDDKILTAWNGLMISAFAKGAQALGDEKLKQTALNAGRFIREKLITSDGILLRRYRDGDAAIPGFLDDYAFFANACLDLYETTLDGEWLALGRKLADDMRKLFEDTADGGFFSTVEGAPDVVMRLKEDYDGAEPSGNSVAVMVLLRLAQFTGIDDYARSAERAIRALGARMESSPVSVPQLVVGLVASRRKAQQVVLAGDSAELLARVHRSFAPFRVVMAADANPATVAMTPIAGRAAAYVCEDFACQLPVTDVARLGELLS